VIATTPGGINPNPRTNAENIRNWQRLALFLAAGSMKIDANGSLTIAVSDPLSDDGTAIQLNIDEIAGLVVMNGVLTANTHIYTAGETITQDQIVYINGGSVFKADSSTTPPYAVVGIARQTVTSGHPILILTSGRVTGLSGLTGGSAYYVGTAGAFTATPPTSGLSQPIGVALDSATLVVQIGTPVQLA
jgi:hypothetical protein